MQLSVRLHISKKAVLITLLALVLASAGTALYLLQDNTNPLPQSVKSQIGYKAIYPSKVSQIDPNSYAYQADGKTLSFIVTTNNAHVTFTEQPAPNTLGSDGQPYYPALGLHPYAQFKTKLGPVALAKFWKAGSLKPVGESAILATGGTLLIAHSDKDLTNAQWKTLFDSLKTGQ
jgi:hypothetical protein